MTTIDEKIDGPTIDDTIRLLTTKKWQSSTDWRLSEALDQAVEALKWKKALKIWSCNRLEEGTDGTIYRLTISTGKEFDETFNDTLPEKKGHWIIGKYKDTCSECRYTTKADRVQGKIVYSFCPFCGVPMDLENDNV